MEHHLSLAAAYGVVVLLYLLAYRRIPALRIDGDVPLRNDAAAPLRIDAAAPLRVDEVAPLDVTKRSAGVPTFARPWKEFGLALLAGVAVLGIGQLYVRGLLLRPEGSFLVASANQLLIFSSVLLLPILRRQGPETLYAAWPRLPLRAGVGILLALVALGVFALASQGTPSFSMLLEGVCRVDRVPILVQVLLEDLTIGLLLCRLAAALRKRFVAAAVVAGLFVVGHIPAMVTTGASASELALLLLDFVLAFGVVFALVRTRDIVWFFPIHFVLDVTQFLAPSAP